MTVVRIKKTILHNSESNSITIYLNPTSEIINIYLPKVDGKEFEVNIYNVSGRVVMQLNYKDHLNITNLEDGIYFIELRKDSSRWMQ